MQNFKESIIAIQNALNPKMLSLPSDTGMGRVVTMELEGFIFTFWMGYPSNGYINILINGAEVTGMWTDEALGPQAVKIVESALRRHKEEA